MNGRVCQKLMMHPASRCEAVRGVDAAVVRDAANRLMFSFRLDGATARLQVPDAGPALRADGLWQHSCFEAFLRVDDAECYYEFNFSPSGAWAAYRFAGRRTGRSLPVMAAPVIAAERATESFGLSVILPLAGLPDLAHAAAIQAGLAAVIEDDHGTLSYWALAHASPQPDFHDPASFRLIVPAR